MTAQDQKIAHMTDEATALPTEEKRRAALMPAWRRWDPWLRAAGMAAAAGGGVVCSLPIAFPLGLFVMTPLLVGVVSAALLRSWWAILIVPVAFRIGFLLAGLPLASSFDSFALHSSESTFEALATLYGLNLVPVALGIAVGVPTGREIERRRRQQAAASHALD